MCSTRLNFHFNMFNKAVLVFLLLTLTACGGGGGDGGSNANVTEGKEINPYLVPDKGSTFYYNNESSGVKFLDPIVADNSLLDVLVYPTGGKEYYFTDKSQIAIKGFHSPYIYISGVGNFNADFIFNDKLVLWQKGNVSGVTKKINTGGRVNIKPVYGQRTTSVKGSSTFHGIETVIVPYGTFEAIHVSYDISASVTIDGFNLSFPWSGELWLVEGVGIVKRSEYYTTFALTDYKGKDSDGDGIFDPFDAFLSDASEHLDTDHDGIGNNEDLDDDGDGVDDINDQFPLNPAATVDTDGDGVDDNLDDDDDGDYVLDEHDYYPLNPNFSEGVTTSSTEFTSRSVLGDSEAITHVLGINSVKIDWDLSSSAAWLKLSQDSGSASIFDTYVTLTIDPNSLSLGLNTAQVILTNKLDGKKQIITVTALTVLPQLTLSTNFIELDGTFSLKNLTESLRLSLNIGSNNYDLTYSVNSSDSGNFRVNGATGVRKFYSDVEVELVDPTGLVEGDNNSEITFTATVLGEVISTTLYVNVLAPENLLLVPDSGVALSKFVTVEKLSHSIDIIDSYGSASTNWAAKTNVPWLTITTTGTTADKLTMIADATGLKVDSLHRATITVSSSDAGIENTQTINVGLWVGSTDPKSNASIAVEYSNIASDPVRPYVYLNAGGSYIDVYNVYDQTLVTTITEVGSALGKMEASADGQYLYVADTSNDSVIIIDLDNVSNRNHWQSTDSLAEGFTLSKTNNQDLLISGYGNIYNALTGKLYVSDAHSSDYGYNYLDASLFGNRFCTVDTSPSSPSYYKMPCYDLSYNTNKDQLMVSTFDRATEIDIGVYGQDIALNNEGTIAYVVGYSYYSFVSINIEAMTVAANRPEGHFSDAVEVGPDNTLYGIGPSLDRHRCIWIYESDGTLRTTDCVFDDGEYSKSRALAISGDGIVSIALTEKPSIVFSSGF